jgi:hypothetical protein
MHYSPLKDAVKPTALLYQGTGHTSQLRAAIHSPEIVADDATKIGAPLDIRRQSAAMHYCFSILRTADYGARFLT